MYRVMDQSWKEWIQLNSARGCDKDGMAQILWDNGFSPLAIISELNYVPQSLELIRAMNAQLQQGQLLPPPDQASLLNAYQAIDAVTLPLAERVPTDKAHMYTVDDFLSAEECEAVIQLIRQHSRPSTITNPDEVDKAFRTSQTCDLVLQDHPLIQSIDQRMAEYMGFEVERSEGIQGQYYQVGQQFKTHTDYFEPHTPEFDKYAVPQGQRTWTFMIYLNDVPAGGETTFPYLQVEQTPRQGKAVIWNSLLPNGAVNPNTAHWAKPIIEGEKYVITKWFRTLGSLTTPFQTQPYKQLPIFTVEGFKKLSLPTELADTLTTFYQQGRAQQIPENNDSIGTFIRSVTDQHPAHMLELTTELREQILTTLKPILEEWVGRPLQPSAVYGIRSYQKGATLAMHVDRIATHQVSAIINVAQQVHTDWPLHICDHKGKRHKVLMQPGEMVLYESARLQHGRPEPFDGDYFANIFAHTVPL